MSDRESLAAAEFEITPEDWEEVNAVHLFDGPLHGELVRNARAVSFLLFVALSALTLLLGWPFGSVLFLAAGLVVPVFVGPLQESAQRNALRKLGKQGVSNGTFGHHRVEVREDGLFHQTDAFDVLVRWHAIDEVKERADYIFIYTGPNAFLPIPVTAFPDSASLRTFADAFFSGVAKGRGIRAANAPEHDGRGLAGGVETPAGRWSGT